MKYEYLKDMMFLKTLDLEKNKELEIKIVALDEHGREIDNIAGRAKEGGSVSINASSAIRRTCSLSLIADTSTEEKFSRLQVLLGLKRTVIVEIGYKNTLKQLFPQYKNFDIIWFPMGVYIIQSPSFQKNEQGVTISLTLSDKGCLLNGTCGGRFPADITLDKEDALVPEEEESEHYYDSKNVELYQYSYTSVDKDGNETIKNIYSYTKDLDIKEDDSLEIAKSKGAQITSYASSQLEKRKTGRMIQSTDKPIPIKKIISEMVNHFGKEQLGKMHIDVPTEARIIKTWMNRSNLYLYQDEIDIDGENHTIYLGKGLTDEELQDLSYAEKFEPAAEVGFVYDELTYPGSKGLTATKGQVVSDMLDTIAKELTNYEYYYDIDGNFVFQEIKNYLNTSQSMDILKILNNSNGMNISYGLERYRDKSVYNFDTSELILSYSNNPQYELIKNDFLIWGMKNENTPIRYHVALDSKPPENAVFGDKDTMFFIYPTITSGVVYKEPEVKVRESFPYDLKSNINKLYTGFSAIVSKGRKQIVKDEIALLATTNIAAIRALPGFSGVAAYDKNTHETTAYDALIDGAQEILNRLNDFLKAPGQDTMIVFINIIDKHKDFYIKTVALKDTSLFSSLGKLIPEALNVFTTRLTDLEVHYEQSLEVNGYSFTCSKMEVYDGIDQLPDSGLYGIYYFIDKNSFSVSNVYIWDGHEYVQFLTSLDKTEEELEKQGYAISKGPVVVKNDWRTVLFFQGIMSKNEGLYANDYFEELENEWPKIYNVRRHLLSPNGTLEDGDANLKEIKKEDITYFLDIIETADRVNQYNVSNIGRRTEVLSNDKVNCIFEDSSPDYCYINTQQPNLDNILISDFKENIRDILEKGYKPVLLSYKDYESMGTGGVLNSAFDAAKDLIYYSTGYNEKITLTTIPIYYLEPNTRISIKDIDIGIDGDYIIDSIDAPFSPGDTMSLVCSRALDKL